jgi:hypothetical protein
MLEKIIEQSVKEILMGKSSGIVSAKQDQNPWRLEIGKPYCLETVVRFYKGIVREVTSTCAIIDTASWVAHTDKYSEFVKSDKNVKAEEPFRDDSQLVRISLAALMCVWEMESITRKLK